MMPLPLPVTVQRCGCGGPFEVVTVPGCWATWTLKPDPLGRGEAKVNPPLVLIVKSSPPLFVRTTLPPSKPETVPPTVNVAVVQLTAIVVTFAPETDPVPLLIVHDCVGFVGDTPTFTLYVPPFGTGTGNANEPLLVIGREPRLPVSVSPEPARPLTLPPTTKVFAAQLTTMLAESPVPIVPWFPEMEHCWPFGWVVIAAMKGEPLVTGTANVNAPLPVMVS
jgi:hypothetical protein